VDAPNGSIVGYSTAPGAEALDGSGGHSPYTQAFLNVAREPNLPIEQLFKRVRLDVNHATDGAQTPWESSSLTSDFYFFGDTAMAAARAPVRAPVVQMASNLPSRAVRQAYDYVLSEGRPEYYQEFIRLYPHDPLCDHLRWLLANLLTAEAWHKAVLANSPIAYKSFYENYANSPYAQTALKLQTAPREIPLLQATHLLAPQNIASTLTPGDRGATKYLPLIGLGHGETSAPGQAKLDGALTGRLGNNGRVLTLPVGNQPNSNSLPAGGKIATLPAPATPASGNVGSTGKIVTLPITTGGRTGLGGGLMNRDKVVVKPMGERINAETVGKPVRAGNTGIVKPAIQPVQIKPAQFLDRTIRDGGTNGNRDGLRPHFADSMTQPAASGGMQHRSFMR
jgi:hypothetical protein